ncbi:hypothetical protein AB0903_22680 [Streptomyces sp. NPDC048389]|uniref:hypothetical protein n=1 Tax=Streptomyces sp. NPDC048389 TaxID=3154622 RepID=UPI003456EB7E
MTLTRGARITGAALCGVLALITGAWIVRDVSLADGLDGFWRHGASGPRWGFGPPTQATAPLDGALLAVYAGTAVAVLRSSVAASALLATAVFTFAVRMPSLWVLTASSAYPDVPGSVRTRALLSTFAVLGLAVGLVITAVAGRRPPEAAACAPAPLRPTAPVAWLAGPLLLLGAAVTTAWQIHFGYRVGPDAYVDTVAGGEQFAHRLLAPPPGWLAATVVILCLTAGIGLLTGAVFARPLGAVLAANILASGAVGVDLAVRTRIPQYVESAPLEYRLTVVTAFFELIAGVVLLVLLMRRGESGPADGPWPGGANRPPPGYGHPPAGGGHGYPPAAPGYGCPQPSGGRGHPQGPPPAGGFGPPPPSSPPPNW